TFMLGIVALTAADVNVFLVVFLSLFIPLFIIPILLRKTIYRDTKAVELKELPRFTPKTNVLPMLFNAAREGAELLFLVIIPAVAVVFVFIGFFDYVGIWSKVESSLSSLLLVLNVHPESGVLSILASPALAMGQLSEIATEINPKLVVG